MKYGIFLYFVMLLYSSVLWVCIVGCVGLRIYIIIYFFFWSGHISSFLSIIYIYKVKF